MNEIFSEQSRLGGVPKADRGPYDVTITNHLELDWIGIKL